MNHGLPAATVAKIHGVLSRHAEVERAILYGSRAKGNFKPGSDIDLTLAGSGLDERIRGRIDEELDDLLLPYKFDLSLFADLTHAELIDHIRRVGVVFYKKKPMADGVKN
jgi:predicted nucleotidyltransferase